MSDDTRYVEIDLSETVRRAQEQAQRGVHVADPRAQAMELLTRMRELERGADRTWVRPGALCVERDGLGLLGFAKPGEVVLVVLRELDRHLEVAEDRMRVEDVIEASASHLGRIDLLVGYWHAGIMRSCAHCSSQLRPYPATDGSSGTGSRATDGESRA